MNGVAGGKFRQQLLTVLFLAVAAITAAAGYGLYHAQTNAIRREKMAELKAIAEMKSDQLTDWRQERMADIRINSTGIIQTSVREWMKHPGNRELETFIRGRLEMYKTAESYENILLASPDGRLLMTLVKNRDHLTSIEVDEVRRAAQEHKAIIGDFFRCEVCGRVHIDVLAPIMDEQGRPVAVLTLRTDPEVTLFPLVERWPLPSASAETLFLRREGDHIRFLNKLRHKPYPPLTFTLPVSRTDVPGVQVALGRRGEFEGNDYRDVRVMADLREIPDSPWLMITKVDKDELLAEARYRGGVILILAALGILLTGGGAALFHNRRNAVLYKTLLEVEQEKQATQEEIRATLYSIGDGVIAADAQGLITRMNPVAEALTGWRESEAVGKPLKQIFRLIHEETRQEMDGPLDQVLLKGHTVGLDEGACLVSRSGKEYPVADSGAPIRRSDGSVLGVVLVFRDKTAERAAEEALRERDAWFRMLIDSLSNIAVQGYGPDGTVHYWNRANETIYGYTAEEAIGRNLLDLVVPPEMRDYVRGAIRHGAETGEMPAASELSLLRKDGSRVPVYSSHVALLRKNKEPELFCIDVDISERLRAEAALRQERDFSNAILDNTPGIIYLYDEQCRLTRWNRLHEELTGFSAEELRGKPLQDWFAGDEPAQTAVMAGVRKALGSGYGEAEAMLQCKDGTRRPMFFTAGRLEMDGKTFFLGFGVDISERRRAEKEQENLRNQLTQSQKMESVGRLAGGVAHDFNNMLGVIIGNVEMALEKAGPDSPFEEELREIESAAQRSADLTRQLLAFARKQTLSPKVINLNEPVEGMLKILRRLLGEDIELSWLPAANLCPVKIDPSQVDLVLANLTVNARDAMGGVGKLTIETGNAAFDETYCANHVGFKPGDYAMLAVSDTGEGMDREAIEHLFEPFFTTKERGKGIGLGLSTVYGAVMQNGGFINVYSEVGEGSVFKIYFPKSIEDGAGSVAAAPEVKPTQGTETILLAEDETMILKLGKSILERQGYTVLAANTPDVALEMAAAHEGTIHLLITDVVMPGMNGKQLRERVAESHPGIKTLFMSGYTANVIAHHGVLDEGVEFLQKPFSAKTLAAKVREILGG